MDNVVVRSVFPPSVPTMSDWQVPGYVDLVLLGFGSTGELWAGRSPTGRVALRRVVGGDESALRAVRAAATVVRSLPSPHLVRLRTTLRAGSDDVLVLDLAEGGPLAALLARRGALAAGEVVTAVAPLAEALGQAHAHGLVHGRLRLADVLLGRDGRPLLDGLGLAALHDPADGHDPSGGLGATADVWALGELCRLLLTGEADVAPPVTTPLPLRRAVEAALDPDPRRRPSAADLAAALLASCPARPLQGLPPLPSRELVAPRHARSRRLRGRVLVGTRVGVALLLVGVAGWAWGSRESASQPALPALPVTAAEGPDWRGVVERLDAARETAYARADAALLAGVWGPGSPQAAADVQTLRALQRLGRSAVGVRHRVIGVRLLRGTARRADLMVVEALAAYTVRERDGTAAFHHAAGPSGQVRMALTLTPGGWRLRAVGTAGS